MGKATKRSPVLTVYIFLYNVTLFVIHLKIFLDLVNAVTSGNFVYNDHFPLFCIGTAAQLLDVIHGILGITTTGIVAGLIQVFGRLLMLFVIEGNPSIHNQFSTPILLLAWVLIELFRYPYYALRAWDTEVYALTWLRYTAWVPLYPLGLTMEWFSLLTSIGHYYESGKYSLQVPYLDVTLNFGIVVAVLTFAVMPFVSKTLLGHMTRQRRNKMSAKKMD
ncbi:tyrosine phosphatase-like protein, PTPLA [Cooperia oncophora]